MGDWRALFAELDRWSAEGRQATFWWRDDDAAATTPALERLFALRRRAAVPLALAVIPANMQVALADRARGEDGVAVLQHGWAHRNHAPASEKAMELGEHRSPEIVLEELGRGRGELEAAFAGCFVPALVPPWNRVASGLLPRLPSLGLRALSTFTPRRRAEPALGLRQTNCHVDLIDWRGARQCRSEAELLDAVLTHLQLRRGGRADAAEPTGLLTHHLDHDEGCWDFLDGFFPRLGEHAAVRWLDARAALLAA